MIRLVLLLLAAAPAQAAPVEVLLVAASDEALRPVLAQLTDVQSHPRAAWTTWTGRLGDRTIALARTEGDPLNAVAVTTLALRRHQPKLVLVFGSARAHDPALRPGDIVVAEGFVAFDGMITPVRPLGAGSDALQWEGLEHPLITAGEAETRMKTFPADHDSAARLRTLPPARPGGRVIAGRLGSAHQVNRETDRIAWLHREWGTSTEDGESAHVAGCALLLGRPVAGFRVVEGTPEEAAALALRFLEQGP